MRTLRDEALTKTRPKDGACLLWTGAMDKTTPVFITGSIPKAFARVNARTLIKDVYLLSKKRLTSVASCGNCRCVAPAHAEVVTRAEMTRRARPFNSVMHRLRVAKTKREQVGKLTIEQAREIRAAVAGGETQRSQAIKYGISYRLAWTIVQGHAYAELTPFGTLAKRPKRKAAANARGKPRR